MPETVTPQPPISPVLPTTPVPLVTAYIVRHSRLFRPLVTITAVLLISGLAFGAYQLGKIQSPPPTSEPQIISPAVSTISLTPSDSANPVANWKTFTNASYKYQLQYPPDWKINADGSIIYEGSDSEIPVPYKYGRVILSKEDNPKRFTDITKWWEDKYHPNGSNEGLLGKSTPETQGTTVNANKVLFLKARSFTTNGDLRYYTLSLNNTVVTLTFSSSTSEYVSGQILSTFKFLGQASLNQSPANFYNFVGVTKLNGYLAPATSRCSFTQEEEACTVKIAFFRVLSSDNTNFSDYLKQLAGNAYVTADSISLGCLDEAKRQVSSNNDSDTGSVESLITGSQYNLLLSSSLTNPVNLSIERLKYTGGRQADDCYSHFRNFRVF